jgi:mannose-6-phosphate isomerase-like protein (cupin superfamily)
LTEAPHKDLLHLPPGGGRRRYATDRLSAVFKADGAETGEQYYASEWHLDPGQPGVDTHRHETNDELFLVLEGCPDFRLPDTWTSCSAGTILRIPAGMRHDCCNRRPALARSVSKFQGDEFERNMPSIVNWLADREGQKENNK